MRTTAGKSACMFIITTSLALELTPVFYLDRRHTHTISRARLFVLLSLFASADIPARESGFGVDLGPSHVGRGGKVALPRGRLKTRRPTHFLLLFLLVFFAFAREILVASA